MKKRNEIEQELDQKELENEIGKDLASQYNRREAEEKLLEGKSIYVIGAINFFGTLFFSLVFYFIVRWIFNYMTMGYASGIFAILNPLAYGISIVMSVAAVIKKKSPLDKILDWFA